jgi:hypothetical protein
MHGTVYLCRQDFVYQDKYPPCHKLPNRHGQRIPFHRITGSAILQRKYHWQDQRNIWSH